MLRIGRSGLLKKSAEDARPMTRAVLTLSAAWSSSGFQTENVRSEPSRDKRNHSPKPPRTPVHAALARGGLDHGAYFTSERAHCEKLLQKGWFEQQHQGPKNEVFFRLSQEVTYPNRRSIGEWSSSG
jgi:hypothetical protein